MRMQSQQKRPEQALIEAIQGIGMSEMTGRQQYKEKKLAREQKVADVDEAQISDLIEKGYLELDPEILKNLEPGASKRAAIKRWIPEDERRASASGGGTKYNLKADEMLMRGLEVLRNAFDKEDNPEAPEYKIDRKNPPTIHSVESEIDRIKLALSAKGKSVEALLQAVPTKDAREAVKAAGEKSEKVLSATPTPQPKEKPVPINDQAIATLKATKVEGTDIMLFDAVKGTKDINRAVKAIKSVTKLTDEQALALAKSIRGE